MRISPLLLGAATAVALFATTAQAAPEDIAKKSGCLACHQVDKKVVGPSYKDVAAKRKGQADAVAVLTDKIRKGGSGVYGPVPMSPNPATTISDADLKTVIEWILKL